MTNILTIARRDLRAYFDSLVAYIVLGGTMFLLGLLFFLVPHVAEVFLGSFWEIDRATMAGLFHYMPAMLGLFVIPLLTMRSLASEKGQGTLELLITMPVRDADVILGKYLAALTMVLILLAASALYPIAMFGFPWHLGALDWGPVWAGYLGMILFSMAGVAVGLLYSSLTDSDIIAFFATIATFGILYLIGFAAGDILHVPAIADTVAFVSLTSRFEPFSRGVIDSRCVVYFLSITVLCLMVAFRSLESRKWS